MMTSSVRLRAWAVMGALATLCASGSAYANLVVNGSFEANPFTAEGDYQLGLVGNDVTGWYIPASDGTYPWGLQNGAFGASTPYGDQFFVLGEALTGVEYTIQQTIMGLVPGDTYSLSFAIASEVNCCSTIQTSFLSGSSTGAMSFVAPSSGFYWTDWATQTESFVATSSSATLQFKNIDLSSGGLDVGLDNVDVEGATSSVPEPGALALMGLGLAALGLAKRVRRA